MRNRCGEFACCLSFLCFRWRRKWIRTKSSPGPSVVIRTWIRATSGQGQPLDVCETIGSNWTHNAWTRERDLRLKRASAKTFLTGPSKTRRKQEMRREQERVLPRQRFNAPRMTRSYNDSTCFHNYFRATSGACKTCKKSHNSSIANHKALHDPTSRLFFCQDCSSSQFP